MTAEDDLADVERVLAGDIAAFEGIVRRWQRPLINLAYRFCRDRSRAEDLAQDAFLRAYRGLRSWRGEALFSTWLFALATNLYRSEIRRLPPPSVAIDGILETHSGRESSAGVDEEERNQIVRDVVGGLPPKYREALTLFYFHGMDAAKAASSLGVPVGTLKARLSRGRDLVRRKLLVLLNVKAG